MLNTENTLHHGGILDVIRTISSNNESGRLQMRTGTTDGIFYFRNGQLVDARVGNLSGFQAINAAASVRDANFNFDPSVAPPSVSSITPSERTVLKQFFGIDTVARAESHHSAETEWSRYSAEEQLLSKHADEVTLETSRIPISELPADIPYQPASASSYRGGFMLALLLILMATTGVALLYTFGERGTPELVAATSQTSSAPPVQPVEATVPASEPIKANVPATEPAKTNVRATEPVKANVPAKEPVEANVPATEANVPATSAPQDLTGKWNIVNTISKTSYSSYKKLEIGFDLAIKQTGNGFTGEGQKISENGRSLPAGSRTPIHVKGSINGDRIEATFLEEGTMRKTNGRFVWKVDKAGALTGTFVSTAARTSGRSTARKNL